MFRLPGNIFNVVSYWLIMIVSLSLFITLLALGFVIGTSGEAFTNDAIEWINSTFGTSIEEVTENLNWFIAIPFFLGSLPWLFFALLVQRSAITNWRTGKNRRKLKN